MKIIFAILFTTTILSALAQGNEFPGGRGESMLRGKPSVYEFKNDNTWTYYLDGELQVSGTYIVRGKYLIATDISGPRACLSDDNEVGIEVGVYSWELIDGVMKLKVIDDDCLGRQRGFITKNYIPSN